MVRGGPANRAVKRAKIFALTKGFRGRAKNCYSLAVRAAHRALQYAYKGRRLKKRDMRSLWIQRINYGVQEHGINYSRFMHSLARLGVQLNRKVLSELAIHEPRTFQSLAELAKKRQSEGLMAIFDTEGARIVQRRTAKHSNKQTDPEAAVVLEHEGKAGKGERGQKKLTETAV